MILTLKGIAVNRKQEDFKALFYGESEALLYTLQQFTRVEFYYLNTEEFQDTPYLKSSQPADLLEVRRHDDLDNYFMLLSDRSILRINVVDYNGVISEALSYHPFSKDRNQYYWKILEFFHEANVLDIV